VSPVSYPSLADGAYTFSVRATDTAGNIDPTPATRAFTIVPPAQAPPAPSITSPASYSWNSTGSVTISGTAQPNSTIELFDDTTSVGTTVATALGTWSRSLTGVTDGAHLYTARASNIGGTSPASSALVLRVDKTPPPAPAVTSPAAGSTVSGASFTLSGTAESGTTIELFEDGVSRGTIAAISGAWSRPMSGVTAGNHSYTARATDLAGNVSALSGAYTLHVN
jgi:hypothetical protein